MCLDFFSVCFLKAIISPNLNPSIDDRLKSDFEVSVYLYAARKST